jgi:hypothetical protein
MLVKTHVKIFLSSCAVLLLGAFGCGSLSVGGAFGVALAATIVASMTTVASGIGVLTSISDKQWECKGCAKLKKTNEALLEAMQVDVRRQLPR